MFTVVLCGYYAMVYTKVNSPPIPKLVFATILLAFWLAASGAWLNMSMDSGAGMVGCPFTMGSMSLCQMDVFSHLTQFRTTFSVPHGFASSALIAALLVVVSTLGYLLWRILSPPGWYAWHKYIHHRQFAVFRYLTEALASGILHPKLYA